MKISKRTQRTFGDFCSDYGVLRTIRDAFETEDFAEDEGFEDENIWGQRRTLAAAFHNGIDPDHPEQQKRLLRVYLNAIDDWGRGYVDGELNADAKKLVRALQRDGAPIDGEGNLLEVGSSPVVLPLDEFERLSQPEVLVKHLERIGENLSRDPPAAIASAKELAESTCKFVLDDYGVAYSRTDGLPDLYRATSRALKIDRDAVPGNRKGSESARKVLQNLATTVQAMAELRNELGLGHGRTRHSEALERHARLAFNASRTVVEFVLQTWHQRKRQGAQ
jgi:Abortive infection C-terminus